MNVQHLHRYIETLKRPEGYAFSAFSGCTLLSTSFALLLKHLLGLDLHEDARLIPVFLAQKNDDDYFVDTQYVYHEHPRHGPAYVLPQFTFFVLSALDVLGHQVRSLKFLDSYIGTEKIAHVLEEYFSKNFWLTSNQLMFLLYFIAYAEKHTLLGEKLLRETRDAVLSALTARQNRDNGFWGSAETTPTAHQQAYGTAHVLMFYDYYNMEIPRVERIIDSAIKLHAANGLVETINGGACEDYNVAEIYLRSSRQTCHRRDEVLDRLHAMKNTIVRSQAESGGFSYRIPERTYFWQRAREKQIRSERYAYSSWDRMATYAYQPDIWATFFRALTVKVVEHIADSNCRVATTGLPGWGFICRGTERLHDA